MYENKSRDTFVILFVAVLTVGLFYCTHRDVSPVLPSTQIVVTQSDYEIINAALEKADKEVAESVITPKEKPAVIDELMGSDLIIDGKPLGVSPNIQKKILNLVAAGYSTEQIKKRLKVR